MKEEELKAIGEYVRKNIPQWIEENNIIPFSASRRDEINMAERIVRVEEGIKHQGELIEKTLIFMEKQFKQMEKRFEQVDKRFEDMHNDMDRRFEAVDRRFTEIREEMSTRFEQMDKRFSQLQWTMGLGFTVLAALMGIFNFF